MVFVMQSIRKATNYTDIITINFSIKIANMKIIKMIWLVEEGYEKRTTDGIIHLKNHWQINIFRPLET
jgi:hypothetical protein